VTVPGFSGAPWRLEEFPSCAGAVVDFLDAWVEPRTTDLEPGRWVEVVGIMSTTFAARLKRLCDTVYPLGAAPYTCAELLEAHQ
jgi:hypothetical protein